MRHHGHEVVAHLDGPAQLGLCGLQFFQQRQLLLVLAPDIDKDVDLAAHGVRVQRLVQKVDGAGFITRKSVVEILRARADKDDGNAAGPLGAAHERGQFQPAHAGHLHVQDGQGKFVVQQQCQGLVARLGPENDAVLLADQRLQRDQVLAQVIDDQELDRGHAGFSEVDSWSISCAMSFSFKT